MKPRAREEKSRRREEASIRGADRRGVAIFLVAGVIVVVFLLAFGLIGLVRNESRLTASFVDGTVAYQLAEAGVEQSLFALKSDLDTNKALVEALTGDTPVDIALHDDVTAELATLVRGDGSGEVRVKVRFEPDPPEDMDDSTRTGRLIVHSLGLYYTPQGFVAKRQLRVVTKVVGINLGVVAPEHGLLIRDPRRHSYHVPGFTWDPRDFKIMGGKVFLDGGMSAELTEHIMNKEFRPMGEVGFLDLGYDAWNLATLFNGGMNLTHSKTLEFGRPEVNITRKYFNFEGLGALFSKHPLYRPLEEQYLPQVRRASRMYTNDQINLKDGEWYKEHATTVLNPSTPYNVNGDPADWRYFTTVLFPGPLGRRNTTYDRVLPLYGWGDWRRVPPQFFANPTRRDDLSNALTFDGITYVRGDCFLEGWYEGVGTLVVQGNLYVGGDVIGLPSTYTGYPSLLNVVVLMDKQREGIGGNRWNRRTGKIIYKPHHDLDFDASRLHLTRDTNPFLDVAVYAENGMDVDRSSIFDKFYNMEVEFNFASEVFLFDRMPNDLQVNGTDPYEIFGEKFNPRKRYAFMSPSISNKYLRFEEETPSL